MPYTVKQLAQLAGVTARTLRFYDKVGLLSPAERQDKNGYRQYGEKELIRLQQILFYRELDFPLEDIKSMIDSPTFDVKESLTYQKRLITLKKRRLEKIISSIDATIKSMDNNQTPTDRDIYGDWATDEEIASYKKEAKERWGETDAYKQSAERTKNYTKADWAKLREDGDKFMKLAAETAPKGATSPEFQALIAQHYNSLRTFYEPNLTMYRGLANMYVDDPRFTKYYEKYAPGLAQVFKEAMLYFCDQEEAKAKKSGE